MFMRSVEFAGTPDAERAKAASRDWFRPNVTKHDGKLPPEHPRILATLSQVQSATSLVRMIRDPLGYVWKYALGFDAPEFVDEPVLVDARVKGNILHAILRAALERLKPKGGFQNVSEQVLRDEVRKARASVGVRMEQSQPIPPTLIWVSALDEAERMAVETLSRDFGGGEGTQSWAEVPFGGDLKWLPEDLPWPADLEVVIAGTGGIRVKGSIDRLDLNASTSLAGVIDYKSGRTPANPEELGINGGKELQRAIYGTVVKTLLPGVEKIESALYYPVTGTYVPMNDIETHMEQVADAIRKASTVLLSGYALPGIGAADPYNDMLFAFPARAINVYLDQKRPLMVSEFAELEKVWEQK
jgi:ATP-dependent helicase/DNAse subunit B